MSVCVPSVKIHPVSANIIRQIDSLPTRAIGRANKRALRVLAMFANHLGECFPSYKTIAKHLGLTYDGARKRVYALVSAGLVKAYKRLEDNGRRTANGYVVTIPCHTSYDHTEHKSCAGVEQIGGGTWENFPGHTEQSSQADPVVEPPEPIPPPPAAEQRREVAGQEGNSRRRAADWRWWFPRRRMAGYVMPSSGEPRPPGTVVSEVRNARKTFGSSFLAHILGCNEQEGDR